MSTRYPQNPYSTKALTHIELSPYLERLSLPPTLVGSPPSLALLTQLYTAQNESVPKDTSLLHVPAEQWNGPSTPIILSSALGTMPVGGEARARIVDLGAGGFCYATNGTFAEVLRGCGFRVSECATRCYLGRRTGEDPRTHADGWHWGTLTHIVMIVDWDRSDGRYLVDAGWGPWGQTLPRVQIIHMQHTIGAYIDSCSIKLEDGVPSRGLNSYEAFEMRYEELPLSPWIPKPVDLIPGWSLYRFITPPDTPITFPITSSTPGHWSPHLHFLPISMPALDLTLYSHFFATHELAHFTAFWLVSRQLPGTKGARRSMMFGERGPGDVRHAKVFTTGGEEGRGRKEGRDVEFVPMETGPMRAYLEREFGFKFALQ